MENQSRRRRNNFGGRFSYHIVTSGGGGVKYIGSDRVGVEGSESIKEERRRFGEDGSKTDSSSLREGLDGSTDPKESCDGTSSFDMTMTEGEKRI